MDRSDFDAFKKRHMAFWHFEEVESPLVGFAIGAGMDSWSYWQDNRAAQQLLNRAQVKPEDVDPGAFLEDQQRYLEISDQVGDDVVRAAMPLASIPWMEAILGCPIVSTEAHMTSRPLAADPDTLELSPFDPDNPWASKYLEFIRVYSEAFHDRHPVAQSVLRGPSDLACALVGAENATIALTVQPEAMQRLLEHVTTVEMDFLRLQQEHLPRFRDGYVVGQYELWAPGPVLRLQEDFSTLYSPKLYSEFLQHLDQRLSSLADYALIHLHSSSLFLIDRFLQVAGIRAFQVTKDPGSASLPDMIPGLRKIQAAGRPLVVKGRFDEADLSLMKRELLPLGLCVQPVVDSVARAREMLPDLRRW